jgi:hypothetical protein
MNLKIFTSFRNASMLSIKGLCFCILVLCSSKLTAQMVLISGTSFDPVVATDTSRAFWGVNDIQYTGFQQGTSFDITPPLTPNVDANIFDAKFYYGITNNANKLDKVRYNKTIGAASDNQLVFSPYRGAGQTNFLSYSVSNLAANSAYEVRISYCSAVSTSYTTCGPGEVSSFRGIVNPDSDQNALTGGSESAQIKAGQCSTVVYKPGGNSRAIGTDGNLNFFLSNMQSGNCKAIAIKSIEIWGTPKPKIVVAEGDEACVKEEITLKSSIIYNGTYKWEVSTNGTSWTNIGSNPSQIYALTTSNTTYQFRLTITSGGNSYVSDIYNVKAIDCCSENGAPASRRTVYYDDFGQADMSDKTGSTYKVWDYSDELNPKLVTKTTSTPFRWTLTPPPSTTNYTFQSTGPVSDGQYAVASNFVNGANLQWASCVTGTNPCPTNPTDHSGKVEGAALFLNFKQNTPGDVFYTRTIDNLCQKKLFFESWMSVFTNSASGTYYPVKIKVRLTEVGASPANVKEFSATVDRGQGWVKLATDITLTSSKSIKLELINDQDVTETGNDMILDDIKIMACAPPKIDAYFDLSTLSQITSICKPNPLSVYIKPSDMLKTYFGSTVKYLFQWTKTPNVFTSWETVGNPDVLPSTAESYTISNTSTDEAFVGLASGDKVYFRVIAASANTFNDESNFTKGSGKEANINDPCKTYSVSEPIEASIACPLPIHLISFSGEAKGNVNSIQWSTAFQKNNSHFVLERSTDGINFEELEVVKGQNSNMIKSYQYTDVHPSQGGNYYRLKQVEYSREFTYSNTIYLKSSLDNLGFGLYPNPNKGSFTIEVSDWQLGTYLEIVDINGRTLFHTSNVSENGKIEINGLTEGFYFVKLYQLSQVSTRKVVIY